MIFLRMILLILWGLSLIRAGDLNLIEVNRWAAGPCYVAITDGDTLAFVGNGSAVDVLSIRHVNAPQLVGRVRVPEGVPIDLAYQNGILYVLRKTNGLLIVDVTDLQQPQVLGTFDVGGDPNYLAVQGNYVYLTYTDQDLYVVDVSQPTNPFYVAQLYLPGNGGGLFLQDSLAYVACFSAGLNLVDISEPTNPSLIATIDTYGAAWDVYVQDGIAYVADDTGVEVIDVSNPAAPDSLQRLGLTGEVRAIVGNGSDRLFVAAKQAGIHEIDMSNPREIHLARSYEKIAAYNVWRQQSHLYVASHNQGMHILETAYLDSIQHVAHYETGAGAADIAVTDRYLYVAGYENGLYVVDLAATPFPQTVGRFPSHDATVSVDVEGNLLFLSDQVGFLRQLDVTNPAQPAEIGFFDYGQQISSYHVQIGQKYVYSSAGYNGWFAVDKYGTGELQAVMHWSMGVDVQESFVRNDTLALLAAGFGGMYLLNIADTSQVVTLAHFTVPDIYANDVFAEGHYAYVNNQDSLYIIDISDSTQPQVVGRYFAGNYINDIVVRDGLAYLACSYHGLLVLDVSDPANPQPVAQFSDNIDEVTAVAVQGNRVYLTDYLAGVYILEWTTTGIEPPTTQTVQQFRLLPNYPNPFNPTTTIAYHLPRGSRVELTIFNLLGQKIRTLVNAWQPAGQHQAVWDGRDDAGQPVASGVYLYRLRSDSETQTRKMLLLK